MIRMMPSTACSSRRPKAPATSSWVGSATGSSVVVYPAFGCGVGHGVEGAFVAEGGEVERDNANAAETAGLQVAGGAVRPVAEPLHGGEDLVPRVAGRTLVCRFATRETVWADTPAWAATSLIEARGRVLIRAEVVGSIVMMT